MYTFDRIEGDIAVLVDIDDGSVREVKRELVGAACEGDVVIESDGRFKVLECESELRRSRIESKFSKLKKR